MAKKKKNNSKNKTTKKTAVKKNTNNNKTVKKKEDENNKNGNKKNGIFCSIKKSFKDTKTKLRENKKLQKYLTTSKKWFSKNYTFIGLFLIGLLTGIITMHLMNYGNIAKLESGEEIVVSIKDMDITAESLYEELREDNGIATILNRIDREILYKKYADDVNEAKEYADEYIVSLKSEYSENWAGFLAYYNLKDENELKEQLELEYLTNLNTENYVEKQLTEKEITNYYNDEIDGDIKVSHILIKPEELGEEASEEEINAANEEAYSIAKDLIEQLEKTNEPLALFEELAIENSDDESNSADGGEMDYFNKGEMVEEFEKAAYALENIGDFTTEPVETVFGYHIIIKTDEDKEKESLEDVRESIIESLTETKMAEDNTLYIRAMMDVREEFELTFQEKTMEDKYNNFTTNQINAALGS